MIFSVSGRTLLLLWKILEHLEVRKHVKQKTCAHKWVESQQQLRVKRVFELLGAPIFTRGAVTFYDLQKISTSIIWRYLEVHKYVHTSGTLTKHFCQLCNFGDFYAIFEFLSRGTFLLNYNYLSRCAGEPIFIFWGAIHMCYDLHNPKSWCHCHDTWAGFLLNMHKNQLFIFKIFKIRSAEISVIIAFDLRGAPRFFPFQFGILYHNSIGS